jgi:hypothetical protein
VRALNEVVTGGSVVDPMIIDTPSVGSNPFGEPAQLPDPARTRCLA